MLTNNLKLIKKTGKIGNDLFKININKIDKLQIIKKTGYFGIEILNFNINNIEHTNKLKYLLNENLVLILKNSMISHEDQLKLARVFGEPTLAHPVIPGNKKFPEILEIDGSKFGKNAAWHTDVSYIEKPHSISILVCDEVSSNGGGDTLFADLRTSFEKMNDALKSIFIKLEAVHKISPLAYWGEPFNYLKIDEEVNKLYQDSLLHTPVIHPVIRINKYSKKASFFINPGYTSHILHLTKIESKCLLKLAYSHIFQPEFILRHSWNKNDVVIWDNTCTAHYAINDYGIANRKMRRVTVKGNLPIGYNNLKSRKSDNILEIIR